MLRENHYARICTHNKDGTIHAVPVAKLYIDGSLKASSTAQHYDIKYGNYPFAIGVAPGTNDFYKGLVDNVIVYDGAISDAEVFQHYTSPPP